MNLEAVAAVAVPSGKLLAWIVAVGASLFMAGVGATLQFGTTAENIESIPEMQVDVTANTAMIEQLLDSVTIASEARVQILCVVVLGVSGQILTAPEVLRECP